MSQYQIYRSYQTVEAFQVDQTQYFETKDGLAEAREGDYVVRHRDGSVEVVNRRLFERDHVRVGDPTGITIRGYIESVKIKSDKESGMPRMEATFSFGTTSDGEIAGLVRAWERQNSAVIVNIEPAWSQAEMFSAEEKAAG